MNNVQTTLNLSVDKAIEQLPLFRRLPIRIKFRMNPRFRANVIADLRVKIYDDPDFEQLGLLQSFGSDTFTADTPFSIDIDNLEKLLQLIIKYLPMLIDLFSKLFVSILFLILSASTSQSVVAQTICINGRCYQTNVGQPTRAPLLPVVREVVSSTPPVIRSIVDYSTPPYQQAQSYSRTRTVSSYRVVPSMNGNYGYPEPLDQHLLLEHGFDPTGMTEAQMIQKHNALHRGQASGNYSSSRSYQGPVRQVFRRLFR